MLRAVVGRGWPAIAAALLVLALPSLVQAQAPAEARTEEEALQLGRAAFEYRDFREVIRLLDPWVHPPRIRAQARLAEAQEILGISLHVTGETERAKREFEQVLLFDPDRKLDPFLVPPAVVKSFEEVRSAMRETLDRIRNERKPALDPELPEPAPGYIHPALAYVPFGAAHFFAIDAPEWGAVWLGLQLAGLGANIAGFWLIEGLRDEDGHLRQEDVGTRDGYEAVRVAGLALFGAAWVGSAIHGHLRISAQNADRSSEALAPVVVSPLQLEIGAGHARLTVRF